MKPSVSSVILEEVKKGTRSLDQLRDACVDAHLDVVMAQVYAGAQSLASTRRISRGTLPRTFCALESTESPEPSLVAPEAPVSKRRAVTHTIPTVSNARVLAELTLQLGPAITRPKDRYAYCWVLLGDATTEFMLNKTERVLARVPTQWFITNQGENTVVGFL